LSLATEQVANLVLNGAIKVAGFFTGAFMRSEAGRRIFKLVPGEVAMVSMDSFGMFQLLNMFNNLTLKSSIHVGGCSESVRCGGENRQGCTEDGFRVHEGRCSSQVSGILLGFALSVE
jgi:hypothetical protein